MKKTLVIFLLALLASASALAQEVVWSVDFNSVLNNREGGDELRPDNTFLFYHLNPEIGFKLGTDDNTTHTLKGGVDWYQPVTNDCAGSKVIPVVYYQFHNRNWKINVGALPRRELIEPAPRYLWSDSMAYVQPTIRGALVQYQKGKSFAELFVDWRQMQSETRREAFNVYFNGKKHFGGFWLGGVIQYNHLAKRKNAPEGEGVNDDFTINPMLGYDWKLSPAAALKVKAGAIVNMQRCRAEGNSWQVPCGFIGNVNARWKWLEAEENIFAGKDLFPLWDNFQSQLNLGDTYYRSKFYSRTDLRAHIVQNRFVDLSASLTFHATDKITGFWQQISCRVYIDQLIWKNRRDKKFLNGTKLRSLY